MFTKDDGGTTTTHDDGQGIGQHLLMASSSDPNANIDHDHPDNLAAALNNAKTTESNGGVYASETERILTGRNNDQDECGTTEEDKSQHMLSPMQSVPNLSRNAS